MSLRLTFIYGLVVAAAVSALALPTAVFAAEVDEIIARENAAAGVTHKAVPVVDDLPFLRRVTVDLIGRIPTNDEIRQYMAWPAEERRARVIDVLLADERFADRWTTFYADMLRLRSATPGGGTLIAYVHQAVVADMPYDKLANNLIIANGKPSMRPEVGFILGDEADPLAMASVTSQVFMGMRIGCAQCHDHPFDVWKREDFYGLAAFYGKTRRIENEFARSVYTTEVDETAVLWPPEGVGDPAQRKPMVPKFPVELTQADGPSKFIERFTKLRAAQAEALAQTAAAKAKVDKTVDDLLAKDDSERGVDATTAVNANLEAKQEIRKIDINKDRYRESQLRQELADFVTSPHNKYFARAFVNRLWAELVGRGFVEPIDDFRQDNPPSHPAALDYLGEEFVASGYDLKSLIRIIVNSDSYQRGHIVNVADTVRNEHETKFLATPMKRMISEALYDSIITAGHLFEVKHPEGANIKVSYTKVKVAKKKLDANGKPVEVAQIKPAAKPAATGGNNPAMMKMQGATTAVATGYDLENAVELDFGAVLKDAGKPEIEELAVQTTEEIEAQRMLEMKAAKLQDPDMEYEEVTQTNEYDDNPRYGSSLRMASPAPDGHFLRVFGQTARENLGDLRDPSPSMRQALMILNGRLTNEASRVGPLEPMHKLLVGKKADIKSATRLAYREILTRDPSEAEMAEANQIITSAATPIDGMADLRWVLLNCHEFRFLQ